MALDSTIHANENTFKDAIKKIATKTDIAELKAEMKSDIAELKAEIKSDLAELRTELRYMRWFIVIVVSIAVALIKYLP